MTKLTIIYHPRPNGVWPEGEAGSVRAAYDLTHAVDTQPAVTQEAVALAAGGPDPEPEA